MLISLLPVWVIIPFLAAMLGCAVMAYRAMATAVDAALGEDGDVPTTRMVRWSMRGGLRWVGGFQICVGVACLPNFINAMGPLAVGVVMAWKPAFFGGADLMRAFIPRADHEKPLGPLTSLGVIEKAPCDQYGREIGPLTFRDWLET